MVQANIEGSLAGVKAALADELVSRGDSQRDVAKILGTTPAAVTLYTRGRRGRELSERIRSRKESSVVIQDLADQIRLRRSRGESIDEFPLILDAAYKIMRLLSGGKVEKTRRKRQKRGEKLSAQMKNRIEQEQLAAQRNMTLAVAAKDEVTRVLFRQIATDSMRHADILGVVLNYLEQPSNGQVNKEELVQIEAMIREEESASEQPLDLRGADPAVRLLVSSIDMDERKHKRLLIELLKIKSSIKQSRKNSGASR